MLHSCTHMVTVGVKGLNRAFRWEILAVSLPISVMSTVFSGEAARVNDGT